MKTAKTARWKDVEAQAQRESDFAKHIADTRASDIQSFFPELTPANGRAAFSNTIGSFLIPDLLTSQHIVVDLYGWKSEENLVSKYGVDLPFLIELRDQGHITLCASAEPKFFQHAEWMYSVLAHRETVFRSTRLSAFLAVRDPAFPNRRERQKKRLKPIIEKLNTEEFTRLRDAARTSASQLNTREDLVAYLAIVSERAVPFGPKAAEQASEAFNQDMLEGMPQLLRHDALAVKPHTEFLGGQMKFEQKRWTRLFEAKKVRQAMATGEARSQQINTFFAESTLDMAESDFSSEAFWREFTPIARAKLLDRLLDKDGWRLDVLRAEDTLRTDLLRNPLMEPTHAAIHEYCARLKDSLRPLKTFGRCAAVAAPVLFDYATDQQMSPWSLTLDLWFTVFLHNIEPALRPAIEKLIPKLRVVRVIEG